MTDERDRGGAEPADDTTVLDVFGVKLTVSNPRLAEVLTMEAKDALASDVRELTMPTAHGQRAEEIVQRAQEVREAVPDALLVEESQHDEAVARKRDELRSSVDALARGLGFHIAGDGTWTSSTGHSLCVRVISDDPTYASASDTVHKVEGYHRGPATTDDGFLFITADQRGADIFKVAIRQGGFHDHARTVSLDVLDQMQTLHGQNAISHEDVVALLLPVAGIDVGALLRPYLDSHTVASEG